ncbi:ubiquitin thiolesterase [Exophiala aquamarina CBS 119918]|uniref:Ubiquitin carboxyl-terminal hydrolase n=1 Tax=Exophiala aquamarina CBS 119918 TaxID=1182545 RepID=A0A072PN51_9EURO|nr:ubiquitin thiolesterase [Exophiala aquamarina CBS 119918]KEF61524.1 ubiquitin thiolesterase [Exophiala aquamarina CBS 119918]
MPDKPTTVAAYAAGASLAAIAAFYVFGPTFFIDGENSWHTNDGRKRTIIGLSNPANDCFINSVLQALAGLGDLRLYLIKELHRRQLEGQALYETAPTVVRKGERPERIISLQKGPVTKALKDMLDALNERPIYKKTISARPMIEALERAFQTRISRNQQDAQEFLQIVLERLCDEYHAAQRARQRAELNISQNGRAIEPGPKSSNGSSFSTKVMVGTNEGFPFEGRIESQITCLRCGYKTKPSATTFVSLTLNVPQKSSTSLDSCFDILLKSEEIDDFKCDKCRLNHALEWKASKLNSANTDSDREALEKDIATIEEAIHQDPEKTLDGVTLPDSKQAPKSKIRKSTRITVFPKVIAIHLSRSMYDPGSYSTKNLAKVSYTQRLRLGGLLNEHWYKLLGVVCHKGSHNSGHYESFRRNHLYPPFATPDPFGAYAFASRQSSAAPSAAPSPSVEAMQANGVSHGPPDGNSSVSISASSLSTGNSRPESHGVDARVPATAIAPATGTAEPEPVMLPVHRTETQTSKPQIRTHEAAASSKFRRRKKSNDRWWRISDEKIKETRTADVLSMQREVYLLFYELERPGDDAVG